jgi:uncharacterized membrane protein
VKTLTLKNIRTKFSKVDYFKLGERMLAALLLIAPFRVLADLPSVSCGQLNGISCNSSGSGLSDLIISIINIALGLAFLIAVAVLIYGGFLYIFDAGNEKSSAKGKKTIINAIIGLVIIILSYVIVSVISRTVSNVGSGSPA